MHRLEPSDRPWRALTFIEEATLSVALLTSCTIVTGVIKNGVQEIRIFTESTADKLGVARETLAALLSQIHPL